MDNCLGVCLISNVRRIYFPVVSVDTLSMNQSFLSTRWSSADLLICTVW